LRIFMIWLMLGWLLPQRDWRIDRQGWPDVVVLIDTSRSMGEPDHYQNEKLRERAKQLGEFVQKSVKDQLPGKIKAVEDALEAKRRLAFMPDEAHLFEYLTVDEHLRLVARLYGVDDFDRRARALVGELELTGKEKSLPGELSRGMRQKVVIASGLVRNPSVLLFDEPLTGLDPIGIRRMRETIVARGRAGASILVSSHLLHLVEEICTRVIIMDRGRKIADGTVAELASRADLAQAGSSLEQIFLRVTGHDKAPTGEA